MIKKLAWQQKNKMNKLKILMNYKNKILIIINNLACGSMIQYKNLMNHQYNWIYRINSNRGKQLKLKT